eukprot:755541-Hanusia_phi.AAC.2
MMNSERGMTMGARNTASASNHGGSDGEAGDGVQEADSKETERRMVRESVQEEEFLDSESASRHAIQKANTMAMRGCCRVGYKSGE